MQNVLVCEGPLKPGHFAERGRNPVLLQYYSTHAALTLRHDSAGMPDDNYLPRYSFIPSGQIHKFRYWIKRFLIPQNENLKRAITYHFSEEIEDRR